MHTMTTSSNKMVFIDRFNSTTEDFLTQLVETFPNVSQFQQFKTGFVLLKTVSNKQPQSIFDSYIAAKYRDQIMKKDEQFFMTEKYDIDSTEKDHWESFIETICGLWKSLTEENKDKIWQFFRVLIVLNDKCNSMQ